MQHRRNFIVSVIVVSALATAFAVFLAPSAFRWSVFAQVYTTPEPTPRTNPVAGGVVIDMSAGSGQPTAVQALLGDDNLLTLSLDDPGSPETPQAFHVQPTSILFLFEASSLVGEIDIRALSAEDRLLDSSTYQTSDGIIYRLDIYILEGLAGGETRYQLNIYQNDVLINDRIELLVNAEGEATWLYRA